MVTGRATIDFLSSFHRLYSSGLAEKYDRVLIPGFEFLHTSDRPASGVNAGPPGWMNLGYWTHDTRTLEQASENLAIKLGDAAEFRAGQSIVDVGCGLGDLVRFWHRHYSASHPLRFLGVNVSASQVEQARQRLDGTEAQGAIRFAAKDALEIDQLGETFDCVTALECAFQFSSRAEFFRSALRALRPGGRIAIVDIGLTNEAPKTSFQLFFPRYLGYRIPNVQTIDDCRAQLAAAGFTSIRTESIRSQVYGPFAEFARSKIGAPGERLSFQRIANSPREARRLAAAWRSYLRVSCRMFGTGEYFLAVGEKPAH